MPRGKGLRKSKRPSNSPYAGTSSSGKGKRTSRQQDQALTSPQPGQPEAQSIEVVQGNTPQIVDVWIIGSSIVHWAKQRAHQVLDQHIGLANSYNVQISWIGRRGMKWRDLKTFFYSELESKAPPSTVIIHAGANDLITSSASKLYGEIRRDIAEFARFCPETVFVWSDMLPRLFWKGAKNIKKVELKRKRVNRAGREACLRAGGRFIKHIVDHTSPNLYFEDGIHMSDLGNDIFLHELQGALESFISSNAWFF